MAATPKAINGGADSTLYDAANDNMGGVLMGWSISATGAAVMHLRQGTSSGPIVAEITFAAAGSNTVWFGPQGVRFSGDLLEDWISGTFTGVVYIG